MGVKAPTVREVQKIEMSTKVIWHSARARAEVLRMKPIKARPCQVSQ